MRYFFDTEFNENVHPIELVSIGVVADNGRKFYGVTEGYSRVKAFLENPKTADDYPHLWSCNDWVKKHVLPILLDETIIDTDIHIGSEKFLRDKLVEFIGDDQFPEFWAFYGDYDWFLLTRLFKSFDKMPKKWPQICYDLHQYARHHGLHRSLPAKFKPEHNALVDAKWTQAAFSAVKERINALVDVREKVIWP